MFAQFHKYTYVCCLPFKDAKVTSSWALFSGGFFSAPKLIGLTWDPFVSHILPVNYVQNETGHALAMYQSIPFGTLQREIPLPMFLRGLDLRFSNVTSEAAFCGDFFRERNSVGERFHVVSNALRNSSLIYF